jgi:hypothetical protein
VPFDEILSLSGCLLQMDSIGLSRGFVLKNFLLMPRIVLLFFLYLFVLIGIASMVTQDSPIPGLVAAIIGGMLLYFVKSSNFLLPSDKQIKSLSNIKKTAIEKTMDIAKTLESHRLDLENKRGFVESFKKRSNKEPFEFVVLGGSGWEYLKGEKHIISIDADKIRIGNLTTLIEMDISISDIVDIEISGPGTVTSDAGISGGGFGLEGALKGIAIATVVNLLTTHRSTKTIIRIGYKKSEIVFITSKIEPEQARLYFSSIFAQIKSGINATEQSISISSELMKLVELKNLGLLTEDEFNQAKAKILAG